MFIEGRTDARFWPEADAHYGPFPHRYDNGGLRPLGCSLVIFRRCDRLWTGHNQPSIELC